MKHYFSPLKVTDPISVVVREDGSYVEVIGTSDAFREVVGEVVSAEEFSGVAFGVRESISKITSINLDIFLAYVTNTKPFSPIYSLSATLWDLLAGKD